MPAIIAVFVLAILLRPWTVQDSIGVRYFNNIQTHGGSNPFPLIEPLLLPNLVPIVPSPDGQHFFFVSFHGDLHHDSNIYELDVYAVKDVQRALLHYSAGGREAAVVPLCRVVLSSGYETEFNNIAIFKPHWENNGAILFIGVQGRGTHRIYRLVVGSGVLSALTDARYDVSPRGGVFAVRGSSSVFAQFHAVSWRPLESYPTAIIKDDELASMMSPERWQLEIYTSYRRNTVHRVIRFPGELFPVTVFDAPIAVRISPDERWALISYSVPGSGLPISLTPWSNSSRRLILANMQTGRVRQLRTAPQWTLRTAPSKEIGKFPSGFNVTLRQSINDPPVVVASMGTHELALTGPDPALQGIWRARAEPVEWHDTDGKVYTSLLLLPRNFSKTKPLPLVILGVDLPHLRTDVFSPDGGAPDSGFAAQALVAQGFAVLEMAFAYQKDTLLTPQEGPARVRWVDEAVELLAKRGIVDPTGVGLAGWSRSAYMTYYVMTHPGQVKIAAGAPFDGVDDSYGGYVADAALDLLNVFKTKKGAYPLQNSETQYGNGTFWQNKQAWLNAPGFNVDRVTGPMLFSVTGIEIEMKTPYILEAIGAFRLAHRPFEYVVYPHGGHFLTSARQREAAMQATVDWMNFWLQGKERPLATGDDQYKRWETMRADWKKTQAEESVEKRK